MSLITYQAAPGINLTGATVAWGAYTQTFDILLALNTGGGSFTIDDTDENGKMLRDALDSSPAVVRVAYNYTPITLLNGIELVEVVGVGHAGDVVQSQGYGLPAIWGPPASGGGGGTGSPIWANDVVARSQEASQVTIGAMGPAGQAGIDFDGQAKLYLDASDNLHATRELILDNGLMFADGTTLTTGDVSNLVSTAPNSVTRNRIDPAGDYPALTLLGSATADTLALRDSAGVALGGFGSDGSFRVPKLVVGQNAPAPGGVSAAYYAVNTTDPPNAYAINEVTGTHTRTVDTSNQTYGALYQVNFNGTGNLTGAQYGFRANVTAAQSAPTLYSQVYGFGAVAQTQVGLDGAVTTLAAATVAVQPQGTGLISNAYGVQSQINVPGGSVVNDGHTIVTNAFAYYARVLNQGTGTSPGVIGNAYGLYVEVPGGTSPITTMRGIRVLNQGRAGITSAYGLFIDAQSGASSVNRSLDVSGNARMDRVSIGASDANTTTGRIELFELNFLGNPPSGSFLRCVPTLNPGAGSNIFLFNVQPTLNTSQTSLRALQWAPAIGSGATATSTYGAYIANGSGAGAITNQYGIFIENLIKGGTLNIPIWTAGGTVYHLAGGDAVTPLVLRGNSATQSGDLTQWQSSTPAVLAAMSAKGYLRLGGPDFTSGGIAITIDTPAGSGVTPVVEMRNQSSQIWHAGVFSTLDKYAITKTGVLDVFVASNITGDPTVQINGLRGADPLLILKAAATLTGDVTRWVSNSNAVLASISSTGQGLFNGGIKFSDGSVMTTAVGAGTGLYWTLSGTNILNNNTGEVQIAANLHLVNASPVLFMDAIGAAQRASNIFYTQVTGEANRQFQLGADGKMSWGPGGATALDTSLSRVAAATLKTNRFQWDSSFTTYNADGVWSGNALPSSFLSQGSSKLLFGYYDNGSGAYLPSLGFSTDSGAGNNDVSPILQTRTATGAGAQTNNRFQITFDGHIQWGAGSSALDTVLHRGSAGVLQTDGTFLALTGLQLFTMAANASLNVVQGTFPSASQFRFGDGTGYFLAFGPDKGTNAGKPVVRIYDTPKIGFAASATGTEDVTIQRVSGHLNLSAAGGSLVQLFAGATTSRPVSVSSATSGSDTWNALSITGAMPPRDGTERRVFSIYQDNRSAGDGVASANDNMGDKALFAINFGGVEWNNNAYTQALLYLNKGEILGVRNIQGGYNIGASPYYNNEQNMDLSAGAGSPGSGVAIGNVSVNYANGGGFQVFNGATGLIFGVNETTDFHTATGYARFYSSSGALATFHYSSNYIATHQPILAHSDPSIYIGGEGFGTTAAPYLFRVDSQTVGVYWNNGTTNGFGGIKANLVSTSDARFKRGIEDIVNAVDTLAQLRGVMHHWYFQRMDEPKIPSLVAQEVAQVLPQLVHGSPDSPDPRQALGIEYPRFVPYLVEAVRELDQTDKQQDKEILSLRELVDELRQRVEQLEGVTSG